MLRPAGGMCKGQRGDRGCPATPGKGGSHRAGGFWKGEGPGGGRGCPAPGWAHPNSATKRKQPGVQGRGGLAGGGAAWSGEVGISYAQRRAVPPPNLGRGWGGPPHLEAGGAPWSMGVPAWSWHPRGVWWGDIQVPIPPSPTGHDQMGPGSVGGGGGRGPPPPCANRPRGSFPLCITRNEL